MVPSRVDQNMEFLLSGNSWYFNLLVCLRYRQMSENFENFYTKKSCKNWNREYQTISCLYFLSKLNITILLKRNAYFQFSKRKFHQYHSFPAENFRFNHIPFSNKKPPSLFLSHFFPATMVQIIFSCLESLLPSQIHDWFADHVYGSKR